MPNENSFELPKGPYGVILADPPWTFKTYSDNGLEKSPQAHYVCMTIDEINKMPITDCAAEDSVLILWATAPMMLLAFETMAAWGFKYKTMGPWAKQSKTGNKWAFGTGYILRSASEFWLIGTRGKPKPLRHDVRNLIVAPVREHSRKPEEIYHIAETLYEGPRLELFARQKREGWDCWGNETDKFI